MEAFLEISSRVVLFLAGLQLFGAIVAGYRGIVASLLFGLGVFTGAILVEVIQPRLPKDNIEPAIGRLMIVMREGALLLAAALLLGMLVWTTRRLRQRRG